ncbi:protein hairless-like [Ochlerotatus camptorhynchus]|uniref:protein hairless-like n=1 Tax=Ochlerotatus camptorhynchus TaxID=644619 RepID=UPI0031CE3853
MYVINPSSGKEIPNSYPTSSSTGSNSSSSSGSSTVTPHHQQHQEIISKILTKCATMTDEPAATTATSTTTTVNGTATILLSPSARQHHPGVGVVGVSPQSSPASSSSSASSPTADGPQLHSSFGAPATGRDKSKTSTAVSGNSGGTNGTALNSGHVGGIKHGAHGSLSAGNVGKVNGNGTLSGPISATNAPGGRLQFFKDGKFILELARAREGEKTSWISVPRKTFWPPTVSSTNANFHKHESSTSLSFSDDNSSVQSSPWQRDHCWKQTNPRSNISKEMSLYYHRPSCVRFKLSRDVWKRLRLKRRRPYEQSAANDVALDYEIIRDKDVPPDATEADAMEINGKSPETGSDEDEEKGMQQANGGGGGVVENGTIDFKIRKRRGMLKRSKELGVIVQQLTVRVANSTNSAPRMPPAGMRSMLSSSHQQHVSPRKRILRELEKVSLEDSSTMKRSRSKPGSSSTVITATTATPLASVSSNGTGSSNPSGSSSNSNGKLTNGASAVESRTPSIPTTPVSRPISSYSITSLLGHNSSSESSNNSSRPKQETNTTTSHHPYQQLQPSSHYQYLGKDVITSPKSPSDAHLSQRYYGKKKSPSYGSQNAASPNSATEYGAGYGMVRSPDLSPSPEHQGHSFTRYRQHPYSIHPTVSSPSSYSSVSRCSPSPNTNDSASSPYSGNAKYRTAYLASGGSPPSSANPATANSPQHYSRQSPLNFARSPPPSHQASYPPSNSLRNNGKDSSSSPRASPNVEPIRVPATTPTSSSSTTPSIRTVPKKTAALRQQFGSPSSSPSTTVDATRRERSNSNASSTSSEIARTAHFKKELDYAERSSASDVVDGPHPALSTSQPNPVIRPSTVIASPTPHHPVPNPFYMYPPQIAASLLAAQQSSAVPFLPASPLTSYYQHMYNQAAVAAAYRNPLWMHYQGISPHAAAAAAAAAAVSPPSAPQLPPSSHSSSSSSRDAQQQRDSNRIHSAAAATAAMTGHNNGISSSSSSNTNNSNNNGSSSSPSPAAVALNYSAAALAASSHHPHHPMAHHSLATGPWSVPQHDASVSSAASMASAAKDDLGADVPLNLSKH